MSVGCLAAARRGSAPDLVERLHERGELVVRRVEVRADAQPAARTVVVEEAPAHELARDGLGTLEIEADRAAALVVPRGRVDPEAATLHQVAQQPCLP